MNSDNTTVFKYIRITNKQSHYYGDCEKITKHISVRKHTFNV